MSARTLWLSLPRDEPARWRSSPGTRVTWERVLAFRTQRHHLARRAPARSLPTVLGEMGGAQAQLLSAAQLSLAGRVRDLTVGELESALWKHRTLAKAWCMRQTLHLVPAEALATFVRGTAGRAQKEVRWMRTHGVHESELSALLEAVLAALDEPITRTELAERVSRSLGLPMKWTNGGGWGSVRRVPSVKVGPVRCPASYMIQLVGATGVVCSGPNRGAEATFVRADRWIPRWQDRPREEAEEELLRTYLRGYGPATVRDFVAWTRMNLRDARVIWNRVAPQLLPMEVEGWHAWVLAEDLPVVQAAEFDRPAIRFLPYFDSYLLGHLDRGHLMGSAYRSRVYRNAGWIAPVLLVDGMVQGVWNHHRTKRGLRVDVRPFTKIPEDALPAMRAETRELGRFLGCDEAVLKVRPA